MKIHPKKLQRLISKLHFTGKDEQRKMIGTVQKDKNYGSKGCGALLPPKVFKTACFPAPLARVHKTIRRHIPDDLSLNV